MGRMADTRKRALYMAGGDDVATVIDAAAAGDEVAVLTPAGAAVDTVRANHDIPRFHKICVHGFAAGDMVHKYGQVIGRATEPAERGDYVHIHNIESVKTGVDA